MTRRSPITVEARAWDGLDLQWTVVARVSPVIPATWDSPEEGGEVEIISLHDDLGRPHDIDDISDDLLLRLYIAIDEAADRLARGGEKED